MAEKCSLKFDASLKRTRALRVRFSLLVEPRSFQDRVDVRLRLAKTRKSVAWENWENWAFLRCKKQGPDWPVPGPHTATLWQLLRASAGDERCP
jgi:hypothetical protein